MDGLLRSLIKTVRRRLKADEESRSRLSLVSSATRGSTSRDASTASREGFSAIS